MKLIINEYPLQVLPSLAKAIGLNEAIFLQQLHYWLAGSTHTRNGRKWIYNTVAEWALQFPFLSEKTIRRTVDNLRKRKLIETTAQYNQKRYDKTLWFSINYHVVEEMEINLEAKASGQNDHSEQQKASSQFVQGSGQSDHMHVDKMTRPIPETTQRIESSSTPLSSTAALNSFPTEELLTFERPELLPSPDLEALKRPSHARRPAAAKGKVLSEHAYLTRWWCYAFERITGSRYAFQKGKDGKILKTLLDGIKFDETLERACAYLLTPEARRWPKGAPTLGGLQTMCNQLAGQFDGETEAKAIRAGLLPDDDATLGYCGYWTPWETNEENVA